MSSKNTTDVREHGERPMTRRESHARPRGEGIAGGKLMVPPVFPAFRSGDAGCIA